MPRPRAATNPATTMLLALTSWLGIRSAPVAPRPMILRLGRHVASMRTVEVTTHWRVAGGKQVTTSRKLYVSDGMCLLPWARDARSVEIEVVLPARAALQLTVERDRYGGEVLDLSR